MRLPPSSTLFPYTTLFRSLYLIDIATGTIKNQITKGQFVVRAIDRIDEQNRQIRSEEHTSELQSRFDLVCRLLLEKKKHGTSIVLHPAAVGPGPVTDDERR